VKRRVLRLAIGEGSDITALERAAGSAGRRGMPFAVWYQEIGQAL